MCLSLTVPLREFFCGVGNNGGVEVLDGDRDATVDAGKRCDDDLRAFNSFSSCSLAYATA